MVQADVSQVVEVQQNTPSPLHQGMTQQILERPRPIAIR